MSATPKTTKATAAAAATSFEDGIRRLGEIVEKLESGELPLETSLALFEEGVKLARVAQERLDAADKRIEELLGVDGAGEPVTKSLHAGDDDE